ncbi:hypothetical protein MID13_05740 [Vibrio gigantis]|nr:hypothetical protein [Vibrio gigantis]ULN65732.1 hypothetical protein MID13_05740 [Vibrio gigantis]
MSLTFPYTSFSVQGISQQITLYQAYRLFWTNFFNSFF